MSKTIEIKIEGYRKLPNPYEKLKGSEVANIDYCVILVEVDNLPENIPTKTNPREQNMNTKVAQRIKEGLTSPLSYFHILNRGILISAKDVEFKAPNTAIITFEDEDFHGIVDGGHTYRTIIENRAFIKSEHKQYVKIELLTNIETMFEDVAAARNTSVQVKDSAIAELKKKFDEIIKDRIQDTPYAEKIAYKENEDKPIEVEEILAILYMFNIEKNNSGEKIAVSSYSSKSYCQKQYIETYDRYITNMKNNPYVKMSNIMPDIFKLYNMIEVNMGNKYKEATKNGKYGSIKGVEIAKDKKYKSKFYDQEMEYRSPKGFIYPVLGSFRALIKERDGQYTWLVNPFECFETIGGMLVLDTVERSRTLGNNPNAVGKDSGHWKQLYNTVDLYALRKYINEKEA